MEHSVNPFNVLGFGILLIIPVGFLVLYPIFKVQDIRRKRRQPR